MSDQQVETRAAVSNWILDGLRFYRSLAFHAAQGMRPESIRSDGVAQELSDILCRVEISWISMVENYAGHVGAVELLLRLKLGPRWVRAVGLWPIPEDRVAQLLAEVAFKPDPKNWFGPEFFGEAQDVGELLAAVRAERLAILSDQSPCRPLLDFKREAEPPIHDESTDPERAAHLDWFKQQVKVFRRDDYADYLSGKGISSKANSATGEKIKAVQDRLRISNIRKRPHAGSTAVAAQGAEAMHEANAVPDAAGDTQRSDTEAAGDT